MNEGFQFKLYRLVTEGRSGVTWSNVGDSIYIDVAKLKKFLSRANNFCKSKNVTSFIRQLNLYGFKIVIDLDEDDKHTHNKNLKEYSNSHFLRGHQELLYKITRNGRDMKLKLPTSAVPPLPTQSWGKRKRQISKQDQYNPSAKKIKQEVIDETYHPFEYAGSTIEQIDPAGKKIKQEIIDTSYGDIQSNSLSRAECENVKFESEEKNAEYKEISTTMPLRTRHKDKELVEILKPPAETTSKVSSRIPSPAVQNISRNADDIQHRTENITGDKTIIRNGRSRRSKHNFKKKALEVYSENSENPSVHINSAEPQNAAPSTSLNQVSPPTPSPPLRDECTMKNESRNVDDVPELSETMVVENKIETNISPDMDVITKLTEEKFLQMELECLRQIETKIVLTDVHVSDVSRSDDLHEIEEVVVFNPQDRSESTVDVMENKDHQYARNYIEEITPNMVMELDQSAVSSISTSGNQDTDVTTKDAEVSQANDDEEEVFRLLPWRKRPPSSYVFSNILPRYRSDYEYQRPLLKNYQQYPLKALKEDTTERILKSGSENVLWNSTLYRNREAFRRAILQESFRIVSDKSGNVSNGRGELKPKTIQEVLDYKIKK